MTDRKNRKCACCGQTDQTMMGRPRLCIYCKPMPPTEEWPYFPCDPQFTGHFGKPFRRASLFDVMTGRLVP